MEKQESTTTCLNLPNGARLLMQCVKNEKGEWERKDRFLQRMEKPKILEKK